VLFEEGQSLRRVVEGPITEVVVIVMELVSEAAEVIVLDLVITVADVDVDVDAEDVEVG